MQILVEIVRGQPFAAFSAEQLRAAVMGGQLNPHSFASRDGGATWIPVWQAAELPSAPLATPVSTDHAVARLLVPVGRTLWAVIAGYLGLGAMLASLFWMFLMTVARPSETRDALVGPTLVSLVVFAATLGAALLGHRSLRRNPKRHGMGRVGFAYVCSGLLLVAIIAAWIRM